MKFYRESPRIDCWMRFRFSGEKIGRVTDNVRDPVSGFVHEDKLRFKLFPALSEQAVGVRDLPFAVSETADPYVNGLYWTAVADGDKGIAVFNKGTMGAVREKDGGFSIPLAYAAYYVWGTRMLTRGLRVRVRPVSVHGQVGGRGPASARGGVQLPAGGHGGAVCRREPGRDVSAGQRPIERRDGLGLVQPRWQDLRARVRVSGHRRRGDARLGPGRLADGGRSGRSRPGRLAADILRQAVGDKDHPTGTLY